MAGIILPRRVWTRQPSQGVRIDWSNPLTHKLVSCFFPAAGTAVHRQEGIAGTATLDPLATGTVVGPAGYGWSTSYHTNFTIYNVDFSGTPTLTEDKFTGAVLWSNYSHAAVGNRANLWALNTNAGLFTDGSVVSIRAPTAVIDSFSVAPKATGVNSCIFVADFTSPYGVLNGSYEDFTNTGYSLSGNLSYLGGQDGQSKTLCTFYLALAWDRQLSKAELLSWNANPWQIFLYTAPRFYSFGTAGSVHQIPISDSAHSHTAEQPTTSTTRLVSVSSASHAHTVEAPTITGVHSVAVFGAIHSHTADAATIDTAEVNFVDSLQLGAEGSSELTVTVQHNESMQDFWIFVTEVLAEDWNVEGDWELYVNLTTAPTASGCTWWLEIWTIDDCAWGSQLLASTNAGAIPTSTGMQKLGPFSSASQRLVGLTNPRVALKLGVTQTTGASQTIGITPNSIIRGPKKWWNYIEIQDATHAHTVDSPGITEGVVTVEIQDATHAHTAEQPTVAHIHQIPVADATNAHTAEQPAVAQSHEVAVASTTHAHTAEQPSASSAAQIPISDATHAHTAGQPGLTQLHSLAVADATHGHTADAPGVHQLHQIPIADSTHAHLADQPEATAAQQVQITDALHAHTAESLAVTQLHQVQVADATHAHTVDAPSITQLHQIYVQDSSHAHTATQPTIGLGGLVEISDAVHAHAAEQPALTQAHEVSITDSTHGHAVENVAVSQNHEVPVSDATHAHTATNADVGAAKDIAISDGVSAHTAGQPSVATTHVSILVSDSQHPHSVENGYVQQWHDLLVSDGIHLHSAESPGLAARSTIEVADTSHQHSVTQPATTQDFMVVGQDSAHGHSAELLRLLQTHEIRISRGDSGQAADGLPITQWHDLPIANATHPHTVDCPPYLYVAPYKPPERMYRIGSENRLFWVQSEDRILGISPENKLVYVQRSK